MEKSKNGNDKSQSASQDGNDRVEGGKAIMDQMVKLWPFLNAAERTVLSDFVMDLEFSSKLILHLGRKYQKNLEANQETASQEVQKDQVSGIVEKKIASYPIIDSKPSNDINQDKATDPSCFSEKQVERLDNVICVRLQLLPYKYSRSFYIQAQETVAMIWKHVAETLPHFHLTRSYIDLNSIMFSLITKTSIYSCSNASKSQEKYLFSGGDVIEFNWDPIRVVKTTIEKPKAVKTATVRVHFGPISYQTSFNFHIYQGESVSEIWKRAYNVAIHAGYDLSGVDMNSVSLVHGNEKVENANTSTCVLAYQNLATLFFDWKTIVSDCSNKPSEYIVQEKQISDPTIESTKTEPVKTVETIVKPVLVHFILRPFGIQTFFSSAINQGQTVGFIWNKTVLLSTGYSIKQDSIDYDTLSFKQYHSGCVKKCIEHVNNPANAQELLYFEEGDILEFDWNNKPQPVPTFQVAIRFFPLARLDTLKYFQVKQGETASEIWKRAIALASKTESFPVNIISLLSTSIVHYRNKVTLSKIEPAWSSKSTFQIQDGDHLELDWIYSTFSCNVYLAPLQATISMCLNPTESLFSIFHRAMNSVSSKHSSSTQNFKNIHIWTTTNKTSPIDVPFHSCVKDCVLDPSSTIHFSWTQ